jgi:hypothetical protein
MEHQAYRCCLPTLAGFAGNHCIGPGLRRRPTVYSPTSPPRRGIRPSYSGLLVQGTATSPSSTTKTAAAKLFRGHIMNQKSGADGQDRTDDLRFTKPLLYQLSYIGEICAGHYATFPRPRKQIEMAKARRDCLGKNIGASMGMAPKSAMNKAAGVERETGAALCPCVPFVDETLLRKKWGVVAMGEMRGQEGTLSCSPVLEPC